MSGDGIKQGLCGRHTVEVDESRCARADILHGRARVFATPEMVRAMEIACYNAVKDHLPPEQSTVGTFVNVKHTRATPMGDNVTAMGDLVEVEGRRLLFKVEAKDSQGIIGRGEHGRYVIDVEDFIASLNR